MPVANDDDYRTGQDTTLVVPTVDGVHSNDTDPNMDVLTPVLVQDVSYGTLTLGGDGGFTYVPNAGFWGTDSFVYAANDGSISFELYTTSPQVIHNIGSLSATTTLYSSARRGSKKGTPSSSS